MNASKKNGVILVAISLFLAFAFSACEEHRYYQQNNRHSDNYNKRHHKVMRPGLDINIHN